MMLISFFLYFIIIISFTGCDNESTQDSYLENFTVKDGTQIKVRTDTICFLMTDDFPVINNVFFDPDNTETLKRFSDVRKENYYMKAIFGDWCQENGLIPGKEYLVREEYYYQTITDNPKHIAVPYIPENHKIGFTKNNDTDLMIGYSTTSTALPYDGTSCNAKTMLIHVVYDAEGNSIDKFIPCDPYKLEWTYSWYYISDIVK